MEFHLLPLLFSFLLVVVVVVNDAYPLPKASRNLLTQLPAVATKMGENSINSHKDASSATGYNAIYGTSNYDSVYGKPPNVEGRSSTDAPPKDAASVTAYPQINGTSQVGKNIPDPDPGDDGSGLNVFLEKDLHPGTKMVVRFTKTSNASRFLPRQVAESVPFSSDKLREILNWFSVKENSGEAKVIENTIKECEKPAVEGEDKYCARWVEAMIDFSSSKLGKDIRVVPNVVEAEEQEYEFEEGVETVGEKAVVCHQLNYPYAVVLCHVFQKTKIYRVPLVGRRDGSRVRALTVCHEDTSTFAPNALALRQLNVKPGAVPICHFLPNGHFVWVPN